MTVHLSASLDETPHVPSGPPFALAAAVRETLRDAAEIRQVERPTAKDAEALELWLGTVTLRRDAPRDFWAALELVGKDAAELVAAGVWWVGSAPATWSAA